MVWIIRWYRNLFWLTRIRVCMASAAEPFQLSVILLKRRNVSTLRSRSWYDQCIPTRQFMVLGLPLLF
jgi:hypothetical protein